jgi:hypothetical protein
LWPRGENANVPVPRSIRHRAETPTTPPKPTAQAQADQVHELTAQSVSKVGIAGRLGMHRAERLSRPGERLIGARGWLRGTGVKCTIGMYHVIQETLSKSLVLLGGWGTRIRT